MLEKLLLAVGLTLSLHIFPGVTTSPKLPQSLVMRSSETLTEFLKLPVVATPSRTESQI